MAKNFFMMDFLLKDFDIKMIDDLDGCEILFVKANKNDIENCQIASGYQEKAKDQKILFLKIMSGISFFIAIKRFTSTSYFKVFVN